MKFMLFIQLALNMILSGQMIYMFMLIRPLQLILNLPLFMIDVPANVQMIFGVIIPIAMFDIFESYNILEYLFSFNQVD